MTRRKIAILLAMFWLSVFLLVAMGCQPITPEQEQAWINENMPAQNKLDIVIEEK